MNPDGSFLYGEPAPPAGHVPDYLIEESMLHKLFPDAAEYVEEHASNCVECSAKFDEAKALLRFFRHIGRSRLMTVTIAAGATPALRLAKAAKATRRSPAKQQIVASGEARMRVQR